MAVPTTANKECFEGIEDAIPQNFEYDFELKGNFTFTYNEAVNQSKI